MAIVWSKQEWSSSVWGGGGGCFARAKLFAHIRIEVLDSPGVTLAPFRHANNVSHCTRKQYLQRT